MERRKRDKLLNKPHNNQTKPSDVTCNRWTKQYKQNKWCWIMQFSWKENNEWTLCVQPIIWINHHHCYCRNIMYEITINILICEHISNEKLLVTQSKTIIYEMPPEHNASNDRHFLNVFFLLLHFWIEFARFQISLGIK